MSLKPGTRLGNYEIVGQIGAGGMGEVYKAHDPKLNRMVAIKVLPAALAENKDFLARFDREAKAVAALSHPNVLGIFDLASQDGLTYAVMELLEGESLRDKLKGGALPPKRAIEIATELAQGLGAAHERGIVHRDVKPENIFLTRDGRLKVLDFGLAKQLVPAKAHANLATEALSLTPNGTEAGMILGTSGYMSPEQVRGETVDARSDIFAFGVVLYEMLSGQRPFKGESAVLTMAAIVEQEPPPLPVTRGPLPPALERLVLHCLEKHAEGRFQSMKDVAFALQNLSTLTTGTRSRSLLGSWRRTGWAPALPAAGLLVALGVMAFTGLLHLGRAAQPPTFSRINNTPGTVESAYFGPDGRTVFFSERLQDGLPEIFVLRPGSQEPKPLGVTQALLMGVTPTGDLVLQREPKAYYGTTYRGTLAQVGGEGGSIKDIRDGIVEAAWDGNGFATCTDVGMEKVRLEFAGRLLEETNPGQINFHKLRRSPDGSALALITGDGVKAEIVTYDRDGHRRVVFTKPEDANGDTLTGLAWGPAGDLWFSELQGDQTVVWSLSLGGRLRLLWRGAGNAGLMDVARDGRMLLADQQIRRGVVVQKAGETASRDVSIARGTQAYGFSADGQSLLLGESPVLDGGTSQDLVYVWNQATGQTTRVAAGSGQSMTPDGRWVNLQFTGFTPETVDAAVLMAIRSCGLDPRKALDAANPAPFILYVPTGAGQPFCVPLPGSMSNLGTALASRDGSRLYFTAMDKGPATMWGVDRAGGNPKAMAPPNYGQSLAGLEQLAPDGSRLLVVNGDHLYSVVMTAGGSPMPIRGLTRDERPMSWALDLKAIYIRTLTYPVTVSRFELATGARRKIFTYDPADKSGLLSIRSVFTNPDARIFAVSYVRQLTDLYQVEGLN